MMKYSVLSMKCSVLSTVITKLVAGQFIPESSCT